MTVVGVPAEIKPDEHRVGMTPAGVQELVAIVMVAVCPVEKDLGLTVRQVGVDLDGAPGFLAVDAELTRPRPRALRFVFVPALAQPAYARGDDCDAWPVFVDQMPETRGRRL